jgi:hypothetical protein
MDEKTRRRGASSFLVLQEGLNDGDSAHLRSFLLWLLGSGMENGVWLSGET